MTVSILLPTRGRPDALWRSYLSLIRNSDTDGHDIEFLFRLDDDDPTLDHALRLLNNLPYPKNILVGKRYGYVGLHHYVNELCEVSTGKWLFLWNDDAIMETKGWNTIVKSYDDELFILNPATNHSLAGSCIFPIIPRKMYDLLGHFSLSHHNDTYVEQIGRRLGITVDVPITVLHDRFDITGNNNDATAHERFYDPNFFANNEEYIAADVEKLKVYINV